MRISDWSSDVCSSDLCLVPADSFYEWQTVEGQKAKQPWRIGLKGGGLFAFAGLWQVESAFDGAACFTILTTAANDYLAPLHERKIGRASCRARACQYV